MKFNDNPIGKLQSNPNIDNLIKSSTKEVAAKIEASKPTKSKEQEITERADLLVTNSCQTFLRQRDIKIIPTTLPEAVRMLYELNLGEFNKWGKEELAILTSYQNAIISGMQLQDNLI